MLSVNSSSLKSFKTWLLLLALAGPCLCLPHDLKTMEVKEQQLLDICRITLDESESDDEVDLLRLKLIFTDVQEWLREAIHHISSSQYSSLEVEGIDFIPSISSHSLVNKVDSLRALSDANIVLFKELMKVSMKIFDLDDSVLEIFHSSTKKKRAHSDMKDSVKRMVCKVTSTLFEDDKIRREIRAMFPMKIKSTAKQSLTNRAIVISHYINLLKLWQKSTKLVLDSYSINTDCSSKK